MKGLRLLRTSFAALAVALCAPGCAGAPAFPLRPPLAEDGDLRDVRVSCRKKPSEKDKEHVTCAPDVYESPIIWDGADNLVFRPLAESFAFPSHHEARNANSLDEVADSAWFTNRLGVRPVPHDELVAGACKKAQLLDPSTAEDGTWFVDKGKSDGSSPGFRVNVPGKGKYMFKLEPKDQPEHPSAASVVGAAIYAAAGYNTSCEQVVYFKPSLLKLKPGLITQGNFGDPKPFDQKALDSMLGDAPKRDGLVRAQASAWLSGYLLGPFRYKGTRADDPNDVVPHEERRELRGGRMLAAWIDHFDAREQNSMDAWVAAGKGEDTSPGHVLHYYLDTSDALGSEWDWAEISKRLGYSYVVDWGDLGKDFVTLGIPLRPWDRVRKVPGKEMFAYFDVANFVPSEWKNEYPNPAFSRMTERDAAWMTRILARFTPEMVQSLARMADFSDPSNVAYLSSVLEGRLEKITERYLTRLSPMAQVHIEAGGSLCATDLLAWRGMRAVERFAFTATWSRDGRSLAVDHRGKGEVCVPLPRVADDGGPADDEPSRRVVVELRDGVAAGPLMATAYDLGPRRGWQLAGLERPEP